MHYRRRAFKAVGSVLDIAPKGNYHHRFVSSDSDSARLASDWSAVGHDLKTAIEKYHEQYGSEQRAIETA